MWQSCLVSSESAAIFPHWSRIHTRSLIKTIQKITQFSFIPWTLKSLEPNSHHHPYLLPRGMQYLCGPHTLFPAGNLKPPLTIFWQLICYAIQLWWLREWTLWELLSRTMWNKSGMTQSGAELLQSGKELTTKVENNLGLSLCTVPWSAVTYMVAYFRRTELLPGV